MRKQSFPKINELLEVLLPIRDEFGNFEDTLKRIALVAQKLFKSDVNCIFGINPITSKLITSLVVTEDGLAQNQLSDEQMIPLEILLESTGVFIVENLEDAPQYLRTTRMTLPFRSLAVIAFSSKHHQTPLGVLYLYFKQKQRFGPMDEELFSFFMSQVSFLLQEAWLLRRYQAVAQIGKEINQQLDTVENLVQQLKKFVGEILDIHHAFLLADYQPQTNTIDIYLEEEGRPVRVPENPLEGASGYVIQTQETVLIKHYSQEKLPFTIEFVKGTEHEESFIFVPLVFREVSLGVLSIQNLQPDSYDQEDITIVELLANYIALALHNMRLYNSLNQLNVIGQLLTQQPDSERVLEETADRIRIATKADIVVLYPYSLADKSFSAPHTSGSLVSESARPLMSPSQPDDIAFLVLKSAKPIFASDSVQMYADLCADFLVEGSLSRERFIQREQICSTVAIPLRVGKAAVGVLFINFRLRQHFDATRKLFIEGLAHYVVIALQNAHAFDELVQRRIREQKIIQNIDSELSRFLDLNSVLESALQLTHKEIPADEVAILLLDKQRQVLEIPAALGPHAEERKQKVLSLGDAKAITLWVLEHQTAARVDNVHLDPQWRELYFSVTDDTTSELDVPLFDGDEVIGVLNFESFQEKAFSKKDEDFLATLAGQIVVAIKRAQAYEREARLAKEDEALKDISREMISQLDDKSIFDLILEKALELTNSNSGTLELYDPDKQDLWMAAAKGVEENKKGKRLGLSEGVVGWVARHKKSLNVDPSQAEWRSIYVETIRDTRSELAVPMLEAGELRGVINIESPLPDNYTDQDESLLHGFATLAVVALKHAQLVKERQEADQKALIVDEMRSVGEYAFELTHQLGNDLGLVETYVSDIRAELEAQGVVINNVVERKLRNIAHSARNVLDLSGRMKAELAKSRAEDAQAESPSTLSPKVLLEEMQADVSLPSTIHMHIEVEDDIAKVWVIHSLVSSILHNLVNNAVEAMPNGGKITLRASNEGNDGRFVAIRVIDTGIGISEQRKLRIFDLLFSTKNSSGFGLWSARRNALRNHGDLSVEESIVGKGTTFKLLLPRSDRGN